MQPRDLFPASTSQRILHWYRRTPHAPAVLEHGRAFSYGDLAAGIVQWAHALAASSVRPGMLVGLQHPLRYLHLLLIEACEVLGATTVSLSAGDVASGDPILERCDFLCVQQAPPRAPEAGVLSLTQAVIDRVGHIPVVPGDLGMLDGRPPADRVVRLVRTSGTTGQSKVLAMTAAAMDRLAAKTLHMPDDPGTPWNFINLYDFTLRSALCETELALRLGLTAVSSSMETVFADMRRVNGFRITLVSGDARRMAAAIPPDWAGPQEGVVLVKGGALDARTRAVLRSRIAPHVYHSYGANEAHRIAMIREDGIGVLEPGMRSRIVDEAGAEQPLDTLGLIEVGPTLVDGYLWNEAETARCFRDGWYRTFDLGLMPAPDQVVVLGRADDMVSIGGVKFAPHGLEGRIRALPGLREAVLVARTLPDGEEELAVVLETDLPALTPGLQHEIVSILAGTVPRFRPWLLPDLPRTETGKVRRADIRRLVAPAAEGIF